MTTWVVLWEDNEGSDAQVDGPFTSEEAANKWQEAVEAVFGYGISEVIQLDEPMDEPTEAMWEFLSDMGDK